MSNTAERNDMATGLSQWLMQLCNFYCKDILATPNATLLASPGGSARSPQAFTIECMASCEWAIQALGGNDTPSKMSEEANAALIEATMTAETLAAALQSTCERFSAALLAAAPERFGAIVMAPFGMEMPIAAICNIFVNHLWYHDGQLNLIQAINGDEEVHWM
ncbi:MAG: DinB family protein [Armatimonadetes bacterium]|nr:DinB family protein [Armatimonadota bacterium]